MNFVENLFLYFLWQPPAKTGGKRLKKNKVSYKYVFYVIGAEACVCRAIVLLHSWGLQIQQYRVMA